MYCNYLMYLMNIRYKTYLIHKALSYSSRYLDDGKTFCKGIYQEAFQLGINAAFEQC